MTLFDIILILVLGWFIGYGLWFGLIQSLGALVGTLAGAFLAARWYEPVSDWLNFLSGGHPNILKIVCFILIFIIIDRLVGLVFGLINKVFSILSIIPFLKTFNRLLGAIFGFLEGVIVLGLTLYIAVRYPLGDWFLGLVADSKVAHYLIAVVRILTPLLPEFIRQLRSYVV